MTRYTVGNSYDVRPDTQNRHHLTWAKYVRAIEAAGPDGVTEEELRNICKADRNPGFFAYCRRNGWLRKVGS